MIPTLRLALLLSTVFAVYGSLDLCGKCRKDQCMPPLTCSGGLTNDTCGCCEVCLSTEGETCGGINSAFGVCNEGLTCVARNPKSEQNRYLPPGFLVGRCEPEVCQNVKCGMHQVCSVVNGTAKCVCNMKCRNKLEPVCGLADGKDYRNPCKVKETECKLQVLIGYSPGYCRGCVKNGREYKFGETTVGPRKCEECTCRHGNMRCRLNLKCLKEVVYEGYECTGASRQHPPIECPDGYRCNITKKGEDGFADSGVCQRLVPDDVCKMKSDSGPCFGYFVKWHFDSEAGECKQFVYGGCGGNDNRFRRKKGCESLCKKGKIPDRLKTGVFSSDIVTAKKRIARRVKVSGKIVVPKRLKMTAPDSCLFIAVEDVSKLDAPSVVMASQKRHLSSFNLTASPLHYAINFLPKNSYTRYDISAVLNIGWCPGKDSKEWVREKDYLTTSSFPISLTKKDDTYSMDIKLEYYAPAPIPVTSLPKPLPTVLQEIPDSPFPLDGGMPPPVAFSNETVTISGFITIKKANLKKFPTPSCMLLKVEDISLMDASSLLLAEETKDVSGLEIKNNKFEYQITMKKPMEKEFHRTFAVDASISVGWCLYKKTPKGRAGRGDFLTDTNFRVVFRNDSNEVKKDFHVIYYCLDRKCEYSIKERAKDPGTHIVSAIKEKTCLYKKTSTKYSIGSEWETDDCVVCRCLPEGIVCSPKPCPIPNCRRTKKVKGKCCPVCDDKPRHCVDSRGIKRQLGERFRGTDDCETCSCQPQIGIICAIAGCADPICPEGRPVKVPGICCRVCSNERICKDPVNNEVYSEGRIWQRKDCSLAYCAPSGIVVVKEGEVVSNCKFPAKLLRRCPSVCPRLTVKKVKERLSKEKKEKKEEKTSQICLDNKTKKKHVVGEHWHPEPCQVCVCRKDLQIQCKALKCKLEKNCSPAETPKGKCCPVCKSDDKVCVYKEKKYKTGEYFVKDDKCTLCACKNGKEECTNEFCGQQKDCVYQEKSYKTGEFVKQECNNCLCTRSGYWSCTLKLCHGPTLPELPKPPKPTKSPGCIHNGKKYAPGESRKADDGCNKCSCASNGMWACTLMFCVKPKTTEQPETKTTMAPIKTGCVYKDKKFKVGESTKQDCNTCICGKSGMWGCTKKLCIKLPTTLKPKPLKPTGCVHKGKKYLMGEARKADDGCNTCSCASNGMWACTIMFCVKPPKTTEQPETKTTMAPIKTGCVYKGKKFVVGESTKQDCNTCVCGKSGMWGCTKKLCIKPATTQKPRPPGCVHKGKAYALGQGRKADDGCNTCTCTKNGGWACTLKFCITLPKATTAPPKKVCIHKGKKYTLGQSRMADDGCNTCFCAKNGGWGCTLKLCIKPVKPSTTTAPMTKGCIHKGKLYKAGSSRTSDDSCNTCTCMGGDWGCTEMACVTETDTRREP